MFVHNLNEEQQSVLLTLAKEIISADSYLSEAEKSMLNILKQQSSPNAQEINVDLAQLSSIFLTEKAKRSLLLELIGIAYADREFQSEEKTLIKLYAKNLNISDEILEKLISFVEKQMALSSEIEKLLV